MAAGGEDDVAGGAKKATQMTLSDSDDSELAQNE